MNAGPLVDSSSESPAGEEKTRFVAYYRVSTPEQQRSGLGLEAQRNDVREYIVAKKGTLTAEFNDTVSGGRKNRPCLDAALRICRLTRAPLVIARLDRLARNVNLISRLIESKLEFVALDCSHANKFTIHVLAALAEYESQLLSERISQAHAANRRRGVVYRKPPSKKGKPLPRVVHEARTAAFKARAAQRARDLAPTIWPMIEAGQSYIQIAAEMNRVRIPTAKNLPGGWNKGTVYDLVKATRISYHELVGRRAPVVISATQHKIFGIVNVCRPIIVRLRQHGCFCKDIAIELNRLGVPHPSGKAWTSDTARLYTLRALGTTRLREPRRLKP